jgi:predicted NAD/FAD-binding protein
MRVAIIGSGVSGLVAAHHLHPDHDVTVFEGDSRIGGHVSTVDVVDGGISRSIDTGFIVYNQRTYPNFTRLISDLGVETKASEMSFGLSCERTGVEWASRGLASVLAQPRNLFSPAFIRMIRDVLRFNRESRALVRSDSEKVTLGDFLVGAGYSQRFIDHYIVPMGAAIWSAEPEVFLRFPASTFVRFFENHGLLETNPPVQWRVISGGSARYVEKLVAPFEGRIRLETPVLAVRRQRRFVEVATGNSTERFDRVVMAVHSDQALRLLVDPSGLERALLRGISYQENEVVLHTDESLLPASNRARASWNYRIPRSDSSRVLVTYDMNRLQGIESRTQFLVTLNDDARVDPRREIARFTYHHPVFDTDAIAAQKRRAEISGASRIHYCGAYWGNGFHEDGVRSGLEVCAELGVEVKIDGQAGESREGAEG